jgi:Fe-S-cluster containining protein
LNSLRTYQKLIAQLDNACRWIQEGFAEQIVCEKGCAGNCCRIHLSVFAVEAVSLAIALKKLPRQMVSYIRYKARNTTTFSPCPLLEEGACLMYTSRLVICRTHGLPMRNEYRGHRSIGVCQKNFRNLHPIPDDAVIDLDDLNRKLASVNQMFVSELADRIQLSPRISIGEALMLDL